MDLHNNRAWKQITFSFKSGKSLNLGHNLNGKFFFVFLFEIKTKWKLSMVFSKILKLFLPFSLPFFLAARK